MLVRIFASGSLDKLKPGVFMDATGTFNVEKTPDGLPLVVVSAFSVDWWVPFYSVAILLLPPEALPRGDEPRGDTVTLRLQGM